MLNREKGACAQGLILSADTSRSAWVPPPPVASTG
jgi:hypothetical protein